MNEQNPAHKRLSDESLLVLIVIRTHGCRNKVYDLKKMVTGFIRYPRLYISCSDMCGKWEGERYSSGQLQNLLFGQN